MPARLEIRLPAPACCRCDRVGHDASRNTAIQHQSPRFPAANASGFKIGISFLILGLLAGCPDVSEIRKRDELPGMEKYRISSGSTFSPSIQRTRSQAERLFIGTRGQKETGGNSLGVIRCTEGRGVCPPEAFSWGGWPIQSRVFGGMVVG